MNTLEALSTTLDTGAEKKAAALIRAGDVNDSAGWSGPGATTENDFIQAEGWGKYGEFFLGRNPDYAEDTKAHYSYPYSDDFRTVSLEGLRAIRGYSSREGATSVYDAAGRLLDAGKKKIEARVAKKSQVSHTPGQFGRRLTFKAGVGFANRETGTIYDVVIVEEGEALGHEMMITDRSLAAAEKLLKGRKLPAYVTHDNAFGDRLLNEIGIFSDFYRDGAKLRAGKFQALPSFRNDEPERFGRLFDLVEMSPDTFGVSIVFEGALEWETPEGLIEFTSFSDVPDDALFDFPTITPSDISSADFVDQPAATSSLFSQVRDTQTNCKKMNADTSTTEESVALAHGSASEELERIRAAEAAAEAGASEAPAPPEKKKSKAKRKKLEEVVDLQEEEDEDEEVEEVKEDEDIVEEEKDEEEEEEMSEADRKIAERDKLIADQQERIADLESQMATLRKFFKGHEEVDDDLATEIVPQSAEEAKTSAIENYLKSNPTHNRTTAVLAVAKKSPELFQANN